MKNIILLIILILFGCKTQKPLAPVFSPCPPMQVTEVHDTITEKVKIPQYVDRVETKTVEGKKVEIHVTDTIYSELPQKVIRVTVTKEVENLSRTALANFQRDSVISLLNQQIKDNNDLQSSYERLKGKNSTKIWWIGSLLLLLLLLIALWIKRQFSFKLPF